MSSKPKPSLFVTHIEPEERTEPRPEVKASSLSDLLRAHRSRTPSAESPLPAPATHAAIGTVERSGKVINAHLRKPDTDTQGSSVGYLIQYDTYHGELDIRHMFGPFPTLVDAHIKLLELEEARHYSIYEAFTVSPEAVIPGLMEQTTIDCVMAALLTHLGEYTSLERSDYVYDLPSPGAALAGFREWALRHVRTYRTGGTDYFCEAVLELSTEVLPLLHEVTTMDLEDFMSLVVEDDDQDVALDNVREAEILEILRKDYHGGAS